MTQVRVRFPPSPTGKLHIGNARTALFNFLFARHHKGQMVFRIEDTDFARSKDEFVQNEIDAMNWLGLHWDEGVGIGGGYGPYKQSERISLYLAAVEKLLKEGKAYYCFCSPEELEMERNLPGSDENAFKYSGKCKTLSSSETQKKLDLKLPHTVRFKLPQLEFVEVNDLIRGFMRFPIKSLDDFILLRSDGTPTYNLAVMIDDAQMKISHVIRGEDHLFGNTPRQLLLYHALSYDVPFFGHMPMILGSDRSKLSKRHGAFAVTDYKQMGFFPEALNNYMALLGWSPGNDIEFMSMDDMISLFDISKVQLSPAVFDFDKLKWFNGQHLRKKNPGTIVHSISELNLNYEELESKYSPQELEQIFEGLKHYAVLLTDIPEMINSFDSYQGIHLDNISHIDSEETKKLLAFLIDKLKMLNDWTTENIKQLVKLSGKELGIKGRALFHPLRISLTNTEEGPDLNVIIFALGREKVIQFLQKALNMVREEDTHESR
jgi:nondiscriminating glutamyl-tRNA synthetase